MATSYTSDKKIGALDPITGSLSANDEIVVNKNGDTLKASMTDVEKFAFSAKSQVTPQTGDVVVIRRGTDIRQVTTENLLPDQSVSNQQISNNAAIAHSKLATMPSGSVMLGNASNVPTATAVTGDVTISNTGATSISAGAIVDADINGSAAISLSKLATGALPTGITVASANLVDGTIVDADISGTANISLSKLANGALPSGIAVASANLVDGTIVDADINASAAIVDTKLATISTAGKVSNSATTATSANTANAIVTRDANGNFSAGTVTANVTGNVTGNLTGTASAIADGTVSAAKVAPIEFNTQTGSSYTVVASDANKVILMNVGSANTVNLPAGLPVGFQVTIIQIGAGQTSFAATGGTTLRTTDNFTRLYKQWSVATALYVSVNNWVLAGDIIA